ncbi:phage recombination protein Bet [Xylanimonas protaetiae]|uniref:Phage recombination protein Bet n=1 Tax=Xylanimonas protaetiae TaxID=2509457 RepID=A0A4P6FHE0_9MICO|nr:phage recombination protein Bet [Xylanimonas protaetiae]QAY70048.1 phage recombination protein Bet [Xylanimonas protaetiae]
MSTEITTRGPSSDLAIADGQTFFTDKQIGALRQLGVQDASNADLAVFFHQSTRTGLDPFARQIYMIGRNQKNPRTNQWETKYTIQTGIDGYRLIARRVVDSRGETLEYEDTVWCGEDGEWKDVWLSQQPPAAAKVTVLRNGKRFSAIALWREYVQTNRDGGPNSMWGRMGSGQLAKCAEALSLRKAFPQDLSGIYTAEEMGQADNVQAPHVQASPTPAPAQGNPRSGSSKLAAAVAAHPAAQGEEIVDAEVIEHPITPAQKAAITRLMKREGLTKNAMLTLAEDVTGREITGANDLTEDEAIAVVMRLENPPTAPEQVDLPEDVFGGREPQTAAS